MASPTTISSPVALRPDPMLLGKFWDCFAVPGEVYEVRVPKTRQEGACRFWGTASGYFNDRAAFIAAVAPITGRDAEMVYITLNPVKRDLLARAHNRLRDKVSTTTTDEAVRYRSRLLIDVDPKRPTGISATEAEMQAALAVRDQIEAYLTDAGWPLPLYRAMSGNGGALVYRIDLPNDDEATALVKRCLEALAAAFDNAAVQIDTGVYNAARLTKVIGTVAAKGDDSPDLGRVWRLASAEFTPDTGSVPRRHLDELAALVPEREPPAAGGTFESQRRWTIPEVLGRKDIGYQPHPTSYGTVYALDRCLTSADHSDGAAITELANGALAYVCHHNRCRDKGWRDVRAPLGLDDEYRNGHQAPAAPGEPRRSRREAPWPTPLAEAAYHGLAGEFVRTVEPHTEADPAALLLQFLVCVGNVVGRGPHFRVEADEHHLNLFVGIVGDTAKARKGTSAGHARRPLALVDPEWEAKHIHSGLSSGEGFAFAVRDPISKTEPVRENGRPTGEHQTVIVDPGVVDKRLLVLEHELAGALRTMGREGNNLSPQLRDAWDGRPLGTMTKHNPVRATGAHISIIGHITVDELRRRLDATEQANGLANRFLWTCARRSKCLPEGGNLPPDALDTIARRLYAAITFAQRAGEMRRDEEARELWYTVYPALSEGKPGLWGAVTARAEAQVTRIACLYAILDQSGTVRVEHLLAALAVWEYCEASAAYIFGDSTGDPVADTILRALRNSGPLDRTAISTLLGRNVRASSIDPALGLLLRFGVARPTLDTTTGGKPREVWEAV
ncbi:MAG TPA: hypothetical protein VK066_13280 [Chloroflexota bacterium]|nr:hypothetical protein [Chloroflexota bacterium]